MAKTKVKVIDPKVTAKAEIMEKVTNALRAEGIEVRDGENFGFTKGTIVARLGETDVQIKPITPKAGVIRYEEEVEEVEEVKAEEVAE